MALPIEATPALDEESWIHLCNRMKYLEEHPKRPRTPVIDPAVLDHLDAEWLARCERKAKEVAQKEAEAQANHDA